MRDGWILLNLIKLRWFALRHFHLKSKDASFADASWLDVDRAIVLLNDFLDDRQAESDAFVIDVCRSLQLTKAREQFSKVLICDASSRISYSTYENAFALIIGQAYLDLASVSELKWVLDQVQKHLL